MTRTDPIIKLKDRPHYYFNKIYSTAPNTWFHDLLDNGPSNDGTRRSRGTENEPRFWHIFVGVNTRFMDVFPLNGKSNDDVKRSLQWFINKYHPEKLTSDNEPAFTSKATCKLCSDNKVKIFVITDKQHSSLGVIDRAIRTLRDMNTPKHYHEQSHHRQFNMFSVDKMRRLVNKYNNSYNRTLKCTPKEMHENKELEIKFIYRNQKYRHIQRGIKDFRLNNGDMVRYRIDKNPLEKHRYRYSPESYKVVGRERAFYIIQARDGSSLLMPRWKLIKCDENVYPWKTTIPGNTKGTIERIVSYNPRNDTYKVIFEGSKQEYTVSASDLRHRTPQVMTKLERDFFRQSGAKHKE